ncbi:hypothetical protein FGG08_006191 [Glutinoglossum americanum]|uniref:C2H2-type domain-containing protein n=1 Tax=Glutinoglossum americanum TaxID=1670608 RepID=A0A9P8L139_9PEZI|nr:hypothetical protein FGG08_006191 [Glutinoglossum americanum]
MGEFTCNLDDLFRTWYYSYQRKEGEEDIAFLRSLTRLPEDKVRAGFRDVFESLSRMGSIGSIRGSRGSGISARSSVNSHSTYGDRIFSSRTSQSSGSFEGSRWGMLSQRFVSQDEGLDENELIKGCSLICSDGESIEFVDPLIRDEILDCTAVEPQFFCGQTRIDRNSHIPEPHQFTPSPEGRLAGGPLISMTIENGKQASARRGRDCSNGTSTSSSPMTEDLPKKYQCTFCGDRFSRKADWNRHELEQHEPQEYWVCMAGDPVQIGAGWRCPLCSTAKPTLQGITDHLEHAHATAQCARKCPEERHRFWRKNHLKKHLLTVHKSTDGPPDWETWSVPISPTKTAWGCGYCGKLLLGWSNRIEHIAAIHYENDKEVYDISLWNSSYVIRGLLKRDLISDALENKIHPKERYLIPELKWAKDKAKALQCSLETFNGDIAQAAELTGQALQMSSNTNFIFKQPPDPASTGIRSHEEDTANHETPPNDLSTEWCTDTPHFVQPPNPPTTSAHQSPSSKNDSPSDCNLPTLAHVNETLYAEDERSYRPPRDALRRV